MRLKSIVVSLFMALAFVSTTRAENVDITENVSSNSTIFSIVFEAAASEYDIGMGWDSITKSGLTFGTFGILVVDAFDNQIGELFTSANTNAIGISTQFSGFNVGDLYTFYLFGSHSGSNGFTVNSVHATAMAVTSVPGPEAGAGLAGLAMAGIGAYMMRRRQSLAA